MEKKNILKRVLAVICSAVLLVGSFSGYASNSKAADTMAVPEGLEDYTRLGAEAFGITEEVVHSGLGVWATYTANDVPSLIRGTLMWIYHGKVEMVPVSVL